MKLRRWMLAAMMAIPFAALSVSDAAAETTAVDRVPDRLFSLNADQAVRGVVGVGDFNGDGHDDLLVQAVERPVRPFSSRWIDIIAGPFDGGATPMTTLNLSPGDQRVALAVADVNRDGIDDITFAAAARGSFQGVEVQRVSIFFGSQEWLPWYFVGQASRGDRKLQRRVSLPEGAQMSEVSRLTPAWADLDQDGHLDLVLAVDPPIVKRSRRGEQTAEFKDGSSRIVISYGDSEWMSWSEGDPELGIPAGWDDSGFLQEDVVVHGMGACDRSLVGVGDVTGDAVPDLVTSRCLQGLPDLVSLLPGGEWAERMPIEGAVPDRPPVTPGPGEPGLPVEPPPSGYLPSNPPGPAGDPFAPEPVAFVEDLDDDGVADIGLEFTDKTHVWRGGDGIASRLLTMRSSGALVRAGYGGSMGSSTWRRADLDGDGGRDLLLTLRPKIDLVPPEADESGGPDVLPEAQPIHVYRGGLGGRTVLDVSGEEPDLLWQDSSLGLEAIGDFNGDGFDDVVLGPPSGSARAELGVLFGPLVR